MGLNVIITGATGMVGKGVLLECLDSKIIDSVLIVNRNAQGMQHPKLKELMVEDFFNLVPIEKDLVGYDACFFCLGITSVGTPEDVYQKITYDLTMNFAKTLLKHNENMTFCYVSGQGTDSTEKGRSRWARIKGKTENDLLNLGFKSAFMFRPGFIQPQRGITSRTKLYNLLYVFFSPLYAILKHFPGAATSTTNMGLAMIRVASEGSPKTILGNNDINLLVKKSL